MSHSSIPKQSSNSKRLFSVPNTEEGRQFLKLVTKFGNHKRYQFHRIGRGKKEGWGGGCKLKIADWVAVVADDKVPKFVNT